MENQIERSGQDLKDTLMDDVQSLKQEAKSAAEDMTHKAKEQVESGKQQAAQKLDELSGAIDEMAESISEDDKLGLARYVHSASSCLASLASRLQESSIDELADEAKELARRQPAAFLIGSVALGFGLSRFVKASTNSGVAADKGQKDEQKDEQRSQTADVAGSSWNRTSADSPAATGAFGEDRHRSDLGTV